MGVDWKNFRAKWKEFSTAGLRLVDIASYAEGGKQLFAGVFRAGGDAYTLRRSDWVDFDRDWQQLSKMGYRLVSLDSFIEGQEE